MTLSTLHRYLTVFLFEWELKAHAYAPINIFPQSVCVCGGGGGVAVDNPKELEIFENLGSYALPRSHKCVSKIPWTCLKIDNFF